MTAQHVAMFMLVTGLIGVAASLVISAFWFDVGERWFIRSMLWAAAGCLIGTLAT